jgi:hypothetical protein
VLDAFYFADAARGLAMLGARFAGRMPGADRIEERAFA